MKERQSFLAVNLLKVGGMRYCGKDGFNAHIIHLAAKLWINYG